MCPKDADRIANSVDSDQTAPLGVVRSGSALFAQTYLSENRIIMVMYVLGFFIVDYTQTYHNLV